jgi:hypothetical protein
MDAGGDPDSLLSVGLPVLPAVSAAGATVLILGRALHPVATRSGRITAAGFAVGCGTYGIVRFAALVIAVVTRAR